MRYIFPLVILFLISSCKSEKKLSDEELMMANVRSYFFMGDSVDVEVTLVDTIFTDELSETLDMIDANLSFVQQDIDTLNLMMDDLAYIKANDKIVGPTTSAQTCCDEAENKQLMLKYKLKMNELKSKKQAFKNSSRIFLHLKRSTWANITGYEANVHYMLGDEVADMIVLMDADFNVVD